MTIQSNEDLVIDLMNFSPRGALCQVFIVSAIQDYCDRVLADQVDTTVFGGLISNDAWVEIARDTKQRMDAFYNRHTGA